MKCGVYVDNCWFKGLFSIWILNIKLSCWKLFEILKLFDIIGNYNFIIFCLGFRNYSYFFMKYKFKCNFLKVLVVIVYDWKVK